MRTNNGVLAYVGGEIIAGASKQLPAGGVLQKVGETRSVEADVPDLGRARITYVLSSYRHGQSRHWHWLATRADWIAPAA